MDVAEDVVFRPGAGHSEEELLAAQISVQIGVRWAVGDEEGDIGRDGDRCLQIRPRWDAVELDAVKFQSLVLQIDNTAGNQTPRSCRLLVEDTVVITRDEDAELGSEAVGDQSGVGGVA